MRSTVERAPGGRVVLDVEVPPDEMAPDIAEACRTLSRQVRIPGFRPGRAPAAVVQRALGRARVLQEALGRTIQRAYRAAVAEQSLDPVEDPSVDVRSFEDGQPLRFQATVTVRPEVRLGEYRSIRVAREVVPVGPEDVERALEDLRQTRGTWVPVEDGAVEPGHLVIVHTSGRLDDGRPVDEQRVEGVVGATSGVRLRPEIDAAVRGLRPGQAAEVDLHWDAQVSDPGLAGHSAHVRVEVLEIKRREVPPLDDAFAAEVADGKTLAELRAEMDRRLRLAAERQAAQAAAERAVALAVDGAQVDVPEVLAERGVDSLLAEQRRQLAAGGVALEAYLAAQGRTLEQLREELRPAGERLVKTELVLEAIAQDAGLAPGDEDIEREVRALARARGESVPSFRRRALQPAVRASIRYSIVQRRVVRFLQEVADGQDPDLARARALAAEGGEAAPAEASVEGEGTA